MQRHGPSHPRVPTRTRAQVPLRVVLTAGKSELPDHHREPDAHGIAVVGGAWAGGHGVGQRLQRHRHGRPDGSQRLGTNGRWTGGNDIKVNTDGTFLYTGKVPFNAARRAARRARRRGRRRAWTPATWKRAATSSGFSIQKRAITLSPSTANPGATVEVFGSGWGVTTSMATPPPGDDHGDGHQRHFGPFPISSSGEFTGAFTVPSDVGVSKLTVTATDNNGTDLDAGNGFPSRRPDRGDSQTRRRRR